jgi:SPP1 family predicted phage head-tail adaptor
MEPTQAGELDRRITIEQPTFSQGSLGGKQQTWSTFATVWARYTPGAGREFFINNEMTAQNVATFRVRYLSGLTNAMRISFDGQYWDIVNTNTIGTRKEWQDVVARVQRVQ